MPYVNGTRNESKIFPAVYLFLCDEILEGPVLSQAQVNSIKDNATALRAAKLESCQTDSTAEPITLSTGEEVSADSIIKVEITELDSENIEAIKAQIQNPCNILFYEIIDGFGKQVLRTDNPLEQNHIVIDIENLKPGIYIINFHSKNMVLTKKIVKQ